MVGCLTIIKHFARNRLINAKVSLNFVRFVKFARINKVEIRLHSSQNEQSKHKLE